MKSRLSLTLDPQVTHRAKRVARARKQSLSSMVEDLLRKESELEMSDSAEEVAGSFSERWSGELAVEHREDRRFQHLAEKYGL